MQTLFDSNGLEEPRATEEEEEEESEEEKGAGEGHLKWGRGNKEGRGGGVRQLE